MDKIVIFTNMSSIQKHWENALYGSYNYLYIDNQNKLLEYVKINTSPVIIMLDELSINNIYDFMDILNSFPHIKIALFNSVPEVHHASTLLGGNLKGYENSFIHKINLLKMLESIKSNKNWLFADLTHYIINKYIQSNSQKEPECLKLLTNKEKEIALMVADGMSNKEIVQARKIALSTVKGHIHKIFEKVGVTDRISLALKFK